MNFIEKAHIFAKTAHKDQKRKFTLEPYILHPEHTAQLLWEATSGKATQYEYAAALLHDVVEDTVITIDEIGRYFGAEVMDLVSELTTNEVEKEKEGKDKYLSKSMNKMTNKALNIKLCDRLSNVISLDNEKVPTKFVNKYYNETLYILNNLDRKLDVIHEQIITKINNMLIFLRMSKSF